jgi:hypothetical protein
MKTEDKPKRPTGRPSVSGIDGAHTPQRQVRIPNDVWYGAARKAEAEGTTASAVVRRLLREWVESA